MIGYCGDALHLLAYSPTVWIQNIESGAASSTGRRGSPVFPADRHFLTGKRSVASPIPVSPYTKPELFGLSMRSWSGASLHGCG